MKNAACRACLIFQEGHPKEVEKEAQKSSGPDLSSLVSSCLVLSTSEPGSWSDLFAYGHTHHLGIRLVVALLVSLFRRVHSNYCH